MSRRLLTLVLALSLASCDQPGRPSPSQDPPKTALTEVYRHTFTYGFGAAVGPASLADARIRGILLANFHSVTHENAAKWSSLKPDGLSGPYQWSDLDSLFLVAHTHQKLVRLHAPLWYQQTPSGLFSGSGPAGEATAAELESRLETYFTDLLSHVVPGTGGKKVAQLIYAWDVVNEVVQDGSSGAFRDASGSGWARCWPAMNTFPMALGPYFGSFSVPNYVVRAFQIARAVVDASPNPNIALFYNEYAMDQSSKGATVMKMLQALKGGGVPIDGLGIQGHWVLNHFFSSPASAAFLSGPGSTYDLLSTQLTQVETLGLRIQITELDLGTAGSWNPAGFPLTPSLAHYQASLLPQQALAYGRLFELFRAHGDRVGGGLEAITFWGVSDDHTWLDFNSTFTAKDKKTRPLLWYSSDEGGGVKTTLWKALTAWN